mmetsp:Transcript_14863/g.18129  ORF Transcript_14863/g.18129 Transcript_14863/m.18129 type:complete len:94 (+) Transcript_14863:91-372(+)
MSSTGTEDLQSHMELSIALKKHLGEIGMNGVKGFHYMDQNDNKRVGAKEILKEMTAIGVDVSITQAQEMIQGFVRPNGEMDVIGYLRFIKSVD